MNEPSAGAKITVVTLQEKLERREPIVFVTAYDYPSAQAADAAGVDAILVGDSLAMVVLGYPSTLQVTMDEMLHHARAVSRGARRPLLVGDMPFMSYQASVSDAVRNAGRFLQDAGMDAVKLEGGRRMCETIRAVVSAGIPVQGHIGLTPQSEKAMGGFKVQGRTARAARTLLDDAHALEDAGCFSIVIEGVPDRVATLITDRVRVPTIGIGAGPGTSGQVLVLHDILGLYGSRAPRFVKRYADLGTAMTEALGRFREEVLQHRFPEAAHSYTISDDEWQNLLDAVERPRPALLGKRR